MISSPLQGHAGDSLLQVSGQKFFLLLTSCLAFLARSGHKLWEKCAKKSFYKACYAIQELH